MENSTKPFTSEIALCLSGGAARGAFHLGVLSVLDTYGIKVHAISGTSIGAIVGAFYLQGYTPHEILAIFKDKRFRKSIQFSLFSKGLLRINQENPYINSLLHVKKLEELDKPLHVSVTDIKQGTLKRFDRGEILPVILASAALTPLFSPITYEGVEYIDGGMLDNFPVEPLKQYSLPILGINLHPNVEGVPKGKLELLKRSIFLGWHGNVIGNIESCDYYVAPAELDNLKLFSFKELDKSFALGEASMKAYLDNRL